MAPRNSVGSSDRFASWRSVDFGRVTPDAGAAEYYRALNGAVIGLARSLPASLQTGALIFLMEYAGLRLGDELDFFRNYYPPSWTVIYWLDRAATPAPAALACQAMAMLLHSLDDHLADGQVPASHLAIAVRSQAWHLMIEGMERLAGTVPGGVEIARSLLDDYYGAVTGTAVAEGLDEYCARFRREMATWVIVPSLAARRAGLDDRAAAAMRDAYESFGVAWRLVDDVRDAAEDIRAGRRTAAYLALTEEGRALWESIGRSGGACDENDALDALAGIMESAGVREYLAEAARRELERAAARAGEAGLPGLAAEFAALAAPLAPAGGAP